MIRLFINGLAASAGGGLTYLRNVIPQLARRDDVKATVLLNSALRREFEENGNISFVAIPGSDGPLRRLVREQTAIPALIRRSGAQVLVSAGNFALWNSPVPQILLSRNSLYTSADFTHDLRSRGDYAMWMDTVAKARLASRSIRRADVTVHSVCARTHRVDREASARDPPRIRRRCFQRQRLAPFGRGPK
jgi:hypothetical protein